MSGASLQNVNSFRQGLPEQCQVHSKYCAIVIYSYILFFNSFQRVYSPSGEPKYSMIIQKLLNTDPILMNGQVI